MTYAEIQVERFRTKGLLVDSNLLLMYLIGSYDPDILALQSFKRVLAYTPEDFSLLSRLFSQFRFVVTTPHILSEVSSFVGQLPEQQRISCRETSTNTFGALHEVHIPFRQASRDTNFPRIGLADAAIATLGADYLVLTDDLRFIHYLNQSGLDALNFNHIREASWLASADRVHRA